MRHRLPLAAVIVVALVSGYLLGAVRGPAPATAQAPAKVHKLKMQASWPAASMFYDNFKLFAERVKKMSGGRIEIETMPAGVVVPAFEVMDATHRGVIDGAHTWSGYLIGKHPAAVLFTGGPGGPFGMDIMDHLGWWYQGGGAELYQEWFQQALQRDIVGFPIEPLAPQMFGWFKQPFKGWNDLKGMKIRAVGMNAQLLQAGGATVVSIAGGEIIPAAERGVIAAAEWCCPAEDIKLGFHNIWKHYYMPSLHEYTESGDIIVNKKVWESLSPDLQELFRAAVMDTYLRTWLRYVRENAAVLGELRDKHGVTVHRTPKDVLMKQLETWDRVREKFAAENAFFKKVMDSQRQYAATVVPGRQQMFPDYDLAADHYWKKR